MEGRGRRYGLNAIQLFLQCVLQVATSLRGASATMELFREFVPGLPRAPVANTGQMWLLQVGLYEVQRPKELAHDWVWLVDHAVQIGTVRCLVIVGCRAEEQYSNDRPLAHQDLSVFALEPVEKSDGATVARQLEELTSRTGIVPRAILSDQGPDLKNGIATYCQKHHETTILHDIAHRAANEMKRELRADLRWTKLSIALRQARQRLVMTPLAHLLPPRLRSKARYMNLGELVKWGDRMLGYLDDPHPVADEPLDQADLVARLGWLEEYREAFADWGSAMRVVSDTLSYVRSSGYHPQAAWELGWQLLPARSAMAERVAGRLLEFVAEQGGAVKPGESLPGSTEVLESLIGKGKRLEGQHSQSGFTRMILGLAAAVVQPTVDYLQSALTTITHRDVQTWCQERLGISLAAKRHQAFTPSSGTKTG